LVYPRSPLKGLYLKTTSLLYFNLKNKQAKNVLITKIYKKAKINKIIDQKIICINIFRVILRKLNFLRKKKKYLFFYFFFN
jgi:hypothetical protein